MVKTSRGTERPRTLRRLNEPRPVEVRSESCVPTAVRRGGRWLEVIEVMDRYRTDDRWWTAKPISRTYYELLLEGGRSLTVFRDLIRARWYEQRHG